MYKISTVKLMGGDEVTSIILNNTCIPTDPDNTDYQQYLKWVEEGNTPLPADEGAA